MLKIHALIEELKKSISINERNKENHNCFEGKIKFFLALNFDSVEYSISILVNLQQAFCETQRSHIQHDSIKSTTLDGYHDNFTPSQRVFDMKGTAQVSKIGFAKFRFTKYIRSVIAISKPGV